MRSLRLISLLVAAVALLSFAHAASTVEGHLRLNGTVPLDLQAFALLGGPNGFERKCELFGPEGEYRFRFTAVPPGEYALRFLSRWYAFQSYHVKVSDKEGEIPQVALWNDRTMGKLPGTSLPYPLVVPSLLQYSLHDAPPPSFDLLHMLKSNPLVWLMAIGVLAAVGLPKLLENLDPDVVREVQKNQQEMHQTMGSLQGFDPSAAMSRFLAGSPSDSASSSSTPSTSNPQQRAAQSTGSGASTSSRGGGGGKGRKRK
ncbi:hypothetical protein JCM5296_003618 [Sporobolomyces johnsonii]